MMPIGYELGFRRPLHVVKTRPEDWEEPAFDLTDYVAAVNRMKADTPALNQEGPQVRFTAPDAPLVGLVRRAVQGAGRATALINPDPEHNHDFPVAELAAALESESAALREITPFHEDPRPGEREHLRVEPRSSRVFTSAE
jgi:starch synthase (maltosyl-transferring)